MTGPSDRKPFWCRRRLSLPRTLRPCRSLDRASHPSEEGGTDGFTLLDALVALAILSLILTVVPKGIVGARQTLERSNEWRGARLVAEAILEKELAGRALRPGAYGGVIANRRWQAVLTPDESFGVARRGEDDQRHTLLRAHLTVAMEGRPLEVNTLLIGVLP